jgi:hypothetical protein
MTRSTSFLNSRFLTKTLVIGGLASCPLLLNSDITLAQRWSNQRQLECTYEGQNRPYVFGLTSWTGAPNDSSVTVEATLLRYSLPVLRYVPVAPTVSETRIGPSGIASAIVIASSNEGSGYYRGVTQQSSTFFPTVKREPEKLCIFL